MRKRKTEAKTPLDVLRDRVAGHGNKTALATELGIPRQHLYEILDGKRGISEAVARSLGFEKRVVFDPIAR